MSSRQTRSPSIPIPTNTAAVRSIENAFSLPFRASPSAIGNARPRLSAIPRSQIHNSPERGVLASSPRTISTAPFRTISGSYSSVASRPSVGSSTNQPQPVFEPRIIRAATSPARSVDPACFPASTSPTAPRTRRPSATRLPSAASALIASGVRPSALSAQLQSASMLPPPQIFARPAYLDQSALRDLLVTESSISTGAVRQGDQFHRTQTLVPPPQTTTSPATASLLTYHSYIRQSTPSVDDGSDQDSASSPPPPSSAATPAIGAIPIYMSNTIFRLPTRWNEMDRHTSLQVTPDGRELTFCGMFSFLCFLGYIQ